MRKSNNAHNDNNLDKFCFFIEKKFVFVNIHEATMVL
jgi:hypothetical protein